MKKLLLFTVLLSVLVSCGGRKQVEKALYRTKTRNVRKILF